MEKVVVLGAGESGVGSALLAKKQGFDVFVSDFGKIKSEYKKTLKKSNIAFEEGGHDYTQILDATKVVKSPGIPDTVPVMVEVAKANIPVLSEIEFAYTFTDAKFVAITGSNGKTTTTLLTYHFLKNAGLNVGLAGNIGHSLAKQVAEDDKDIYVLELSSFQLDNMYEFKADVAVLLNITPDHLDRYAYKFENYVDSKFRITQNQTKDDYLITVSDDETVQNELMNRDSEAFKLFVSLENRVLNGAYLSKDSLMVNIHNHITSVYNVNLEDLPLNGKHNIMNCGAAMLAALAAGVSENVIVKSLATFENAEHRLQYVSMINRVRYINDSKATNVDAVKYALDAYPKPIIWIAGGVDKGNDYTEIDELAFERVKTLICLGVDNKKLKDHFAGKLDMVLEATSMEEAVKLANEVSDEGDTVLLSPACASFDLFKNYEDRGERFIQAVKKLEDSQIKKSLLMF